MANMAIIRRTCLAVLAAAVVVGANLLVSETVAHSEESASMARLNGNQFLIHNLSTYDLRLAKDVWGIPGVNDPDGIVLGRPTGGAAITPGDFQEWKVKGNIKQHAAQARYESVKSPGRGVTVNVITDADSSNNRSTVECAGSGYVCVTNGKTSVYILDDVKNYPSAALRNVPKAEKQTQFDMLRKLCTETSGAECEFRISGRKDVQSDPSRVSTIVKHGEPWVFDKSVTITSTTTSSITQGADVGISFSVVSGSVSREYGKSVTKSHSQSVSLTFNVPADKYFWVQARSMMTRYSGDFTFNLKGAGTINLKDVDYDVPNPDRLGTIEGIVSSAPPLSGSPSAKAGANTRTLKPTSQQPTGE